MNENLPMNFFFFLFDLFEGIGYIPINLLLVSAMINTIEKTPPQYLKNIISQIHHLPKPYYFLISMSRKQEKPNWPVNARVDEEI